MTLLDDLDFKEGWMNSLANMTATTTTEAIPFDEVPAPPSHMTYVQIIVRQGRPLGFFAACFECGTDPFPDRQELADAEQDARNHGELRHAYSSAVLHRINQIVNGG